MPSPSTEEILKTRTCVRDQPAGSRGLNPEIDSGGPHPKAHTHLPRPHHKAQMGCSPQRLGGSDRCCVQQEG